MKTLLLTFAAVALVLFGPIAAVRVMDWLEARRVRREARNGGDV